MDFDLPSELVMLKETVSRFVNDELIPIEMESMDGPDLKPDVRLRLERKAKDHRQAFMLDIEGGAPGPFVERTHGGFAIDRTR